MASPKFNHNTFRFAQTKDIVRLAKFIGIPITDACECEDCRKKLIGEVVSRIGPKETWPIPLYERR